MAVLKLHKGVLKMNNIYAYLKLALVLAITSFAYAFVISAGVIGIDTISNFTTTPGSFFIKCLSISFTVILFFRSLMSYRRILMMKKLEEIRKLEGFSQAYFTELNRQISSTKNRVMKNYKTMVLADSYGEIRDYKKAFEVLRTLNVNKLSDRLKALYYNSAIYFYLMVDDVNSACFAAEQGKDYIEKFRYGSEFGSAITHTLATLEYAQGNLQKAENMLMLAKSNSSHNHSIVSCDLLLGKIYLKTDRKQYAHNLVLQDLRIVETQRQKEDLAELMKEIEDAFAEAN